jgi:hypothetical protein
MPHLHRAPDQAEHCHRQHREQSQHQAGGTHGPGPGHTAVGDPAGVGHDRRQPGHHLLVERARVVTAQRRVTDLDLAAANPGDRRRRLGQRRPG